jgi:G2/mitotic-specific cyclin-B, other
MQLLELRNEAKEDERFPNIDDEGNPLEAAEYVDDIYEYYWTMEVIVIIY